MKLITAVVRPEDLEPLVSVLVESGAHGLTVTEVRGFGRQYGTLILAQEVAGYDRSDGRGERQVALLRKVRLDLVAHDSQVEDIVQTLLKSAATGHIGDGKIWIADLEGVIRVRTGERDSAAI